jgi:rhodanese-related sulfurtransferase
MQIRRTLIRAVPILLAMGLTLPTGQAASQQSAQQQTPTIAKLCSNCHQAQTGSLWGNFENVSFKAHAIQLKIDNSTDIVKFDEKTLKVVTADKTEDAESLSIMKPGKEIRIEFTEKDGVKFTSLVSVKPPIKVAPEKIISTEEVEKLVAMGPEKGKYTLVDSRPIPRVQEGSIPTAVHIPYPAFDKMIDKLPKDKNALLIFYCSGVTCSMSPKSAAKAEQLGYTNVKVYHDGMPGWSKRNYAVLSAPFLKEAWMDKEIPHLLLDVRSEKEARKGFIKGAVTMPAAEVEKSLSKFPSTDLKPSIIIYDEKSGDSAVKAAKALIAAGHVKVDILTGGFDAWKAAGYPVETGNLATTVVYVPKPRPGEISIDEFKKIALNTPADILILDVRNQDEANAGMVKGAMLVPDEEILKRLADIPKDKLIVTHCSTGVRAEMAYHKLKEKGYNVKFLNANVTIDKDGKFEITK